MTAPAGRSAGRPLRVGIVGARRVHQGLGPFVARDLVALGAEVPCVLGTTPETAADAADGIERTAGVRPAALADADAFDAEPLDAVCVLTPAGSHLGPVERALSAGRHVLCEKPLLWHPEEDRPRTARALEDRAAAAGLVLAENAQWPWVLPAFEELAGRATVGARSLAMGLTPASDGVRMIGDAAPHPISVAQALRPDLERVSDVAFDHPSPARLVVRATLEGERGPFALEVHLDAAAEAHPREAWLAIDGTRADRCVRTRDYALSLRSGARLVDLPDPLRARLAAFLAEVASASGAPRAADRTISRRAAILDALASAYRDAFGDGPAADAS